MADPPAHPDTADEAGEGAGTPPAPGRPRWQLAVLTAVAVAVVLTIVILHITGVLGAGSHG